MTNRTADTENIFFKPHPYALTAGTPTQLTGQWKTYSYVVFSKYFELFPPDPLLDFWYFLFVLIIKREKQTPFTFERRDIGELRKKSSQTSDENQDQPDLSTNWTVGGCLMMC